MSHSKDRCSGETGDDHSQGVSIFHKGSSKGRATHPALGKFSRGGKRLQHLCNNCHSEDKSELNRRKAAKRLGEAVRLTFNTPTDVPEVEDGFNRYILINPKVISRSEELIYVGEGEGCLSVNRPVDGIVPRNARITV